MGVDDRGQALHRERALPGERLEQQAAQGVDVDAPVTGVAVETLGCDVVERADHGAGGGERTGGAAVHRAGDAEIGHVDEVTRGRAGIRAGEQDVGRFDVAVNQPSGMRRVQCGGDLGDDVDRSPGGQRSACQDGGQVGSFDQAHVDVELAVDLAEVVDRDDVRFVQPRGELGLGTETGLEHRINGQPGREALEGHDPATDGVVGPVDLAHATSAEQLLEQITPEHQLRHRLTRWVAIVARAQRRPARVQQQRFLCIRGRVGLRRDQARRVSPACYGLGF